MLREMVRAFGRLAVLVLVLAFSAGHAGVCAATGLMANAGTETATPTCPLHQSKSSPTTMRPGTDTAAMSCCAPADRRDGGAAAPIVSLTVLSAPVGEGVGMVLPAVLPRHHAPRARDSAPPKAVPTHLLLSVFLV